MARNVMLRVRLDQIEEAHLAQLANQLGLKKSTVVQRLIGAARVSDKPRLEILDEGVRADGPEVANVR